MIVEWMTCCISQLKPYCLVTVHLFLSIKPNDFLKTTTNTFKNIQFPLVLGEWNSLEQRLPFGCVSVNAAISLFYFIPLKAMEWSYICQVCSMRLRRTCRKAKVSLSIWVLHANSSTCLQILHDVTEWKHTDISHNFNKFQLFVFVGLEGWEERLKISDRAHIGE